MKNIILLLVLFTLVSCKYKNSQATYNAQSATHGLSQDKVQESPKNKNLMIMRQVEPDKNEVNKKLDIAFFNEKQEGDTCRFISMGMRIEQVAERDPASGVVTGYYERRNDSSPYEYYSRYDASGNIEESGLFFYRVLTGIRCQYDSSGNVIREEDFDAGYPFSIDMLIKKMKEEHSVDLLSNSWKSQDVVRYMEHTHLHIPVYEIVCGMGPDDASSTVAFVIEEHYLIDGNTGKILYAIHIPLWKTKKEDIVPIVEQYIEAIGKRALDSRDNEEMVVKKFDIKHFNKYNDGRGRSEFVINGLTIIQYEILDPNSEKTDGYYEERISINPPYEYYNEYNVSGNIVRSITSYYDIPTGIGRRYDSFGNVIEEEDFDAGYPFSIDALISKMKNEYNIDLLEDIRNCYISRYQEEQYLHMPVYEVYQQVENTYRTIYLIDGNTGNTLYINKGIIYGLEVPEGEFVTLVEEYINSLKEGTEAINIPDPGSENRIDLLNKDACKEARRETTVSSSKEREQ